MKEQENIRKELKEIAPELNSLLAESQKTQPFKMPSNYFDKMQKDVMNQVLSEVESELEKNSQRSEEANNEIAREAHQTRETESFWDKLSLWLAPKPALAFAGMAALVFAAFMLFPAAEEVDYFSAIDENLLENYLEENAEDLTSDLLADLASAYDIKNLELLDEGDLDPYIDEIIDLDDSEIENLFNQK